MSGEFSGLQRRISEMQEKNEEGICRFLLKLKTEESWLLSRPRPNNSLEDSGVGGKRIKEETQKIKPWKVLHSVPHPSGSWLQPEDGHLNKSGALWARGPVIFPGWGLKEPLRSSQPYLLWTQDPGLEKKLWRKGCRGPVPFLRVAGQP